MILAITTMAAASLALMPDAWVDAVEQTESSGRGAATPSGDNGRASGPFQFWSVAWADCSALRRKIGLPVHPYSMAKDPDISRCYAKTWLAHLRGRLAEQLGRPASLGETWLAWNMGMRGYGRYGFNMHKVPDAKFIKAHRLNNAVK